MPGWSILALMSVCPLFTYRVGGVHLVLEYGDTGVVISDNRGHCLGAVDHGGARRSELDRRDRARGKVGGRDERARLRRLGETGNQQEEQDERLHGEPAFRSRWKRTPRAHERPGRG